MRTSDRDIRKRLDAVIEYLAENGDTHIEDMASYLSVSPLTVRRNIRELQEKDIIRLKNSTLSLNDASQKKWMRLKTQDARTRIQQATAELVQPGDVLYINTSYTALGVLKYIKGTPCTVITNNTNAINIDHDSKVEIILTGGTLHPSRSSVVGAAAIRMLDDNRANRCIIGINSVGLEMGLCANDISEAAITQQMIGHCTDEVILVTTSDKFTQSAPFFVTKLDQVSTLVTDNQLSMLTATALRDQYGIRVVMK